MNAFNGKDKLFLPIVLIDYFFVKLDVLPEPFWSQCLRGLGLWRVIGSSEIK